MWKFVAAKWPKINCAGFVTQSPGMGGQMIEGGMGELIASSIFGAFFGLIFGLILSHLARFLSMNFNRNFGGYSWAILGTFIGAVSFALLALNDPDSDTK
jgi:predicted lipid-binding transport protein (Tim44 family)